MIVPDPMMPGLFRLRDDVTGELLAAQFKREGTWYTRTGTSITTGRFMGTLDFDPPPGARDL